jgi:type IV pilus assembly protein PilA
MKKQQAGFTLIELMIVVAIIGILAAIALPAYQDYVAKAKVSEGVLAASSCRTSVAEIYQTAKGAAYAPGANGWGCETTAATQYVTSVQTDADGVATITLQNINGDVDGKTIDLTPVTDNAGTAATIAIIPKKLYGFKCNTGAANGVPVKYLPGSCRGS